MKIFQRKQQMLMWCMAGFVLGILTANLYLKFNGISGHISKICEDGVQKNITPIYKEYFIYIIYRRSLMFAAILTAFLTRYKKLLTGCILTWTGFATGIVLVISVIDRGLPGILLCITALFPQIIFYFMSYYVALKYVYEYPNIKWTFLKTGFVIICFLTGVATEIAINPMLIQMITKIMK